MKILVTGVAGFIGYHATELLLEKKIKVFGIDNINNYYDRSLKLNRLKKLKKNKNFFFKKIDISNLNQLKKIFLKNKFDYVLNLAALAGVRHSLQNPYDYINTNIVGFTNILKLSCDNNVKHFLYASSSSVYGENDKYPSSETDKTDKPSSLYGATKKSNELIAYSFSLNYKIPTTGLRFFTVYGPWGRPDMALFYFYESIKNNKAINVFNNGDMCRDFTYVVDVAKIIYLILKKKPIFKKNLTPSRIFNVGNSKSMKLENFIKIIENCLNKKAKKNYLPMQIGDVKKSLSSQKELSKLINFKPNTPLDLGIRQFHDWYTNYYKV